MDIWTLTVAAPAEDIEDADPPFAVDADTRDYVLLIRVQGRLDTLTAPELVTRAGDAEKVRIDFSDLDYISSAGLRSLLIILKRVGREHIAVVNPTESVREIFETTGLADLML